MIPVGPLSSRVPAERHARFLADLWRSSASYFVCFVAGIVVIARVWCFQAITAEDGV